MMTANDRFEAAVHELNSRTAYPTKYPAIRRNIDFSQAAFEALRTALLQRLGEPQPDAPFVAVAGSLARYEASPASDVDCLIIYPSSPPATAREFRDAVYDVIKSVEIATAEGAVPLELSNPHGVFRSDAIGAELCKKIGSRDEDYDNISRRLLLLLESQPLWNDSAFDALRSQLVHEYAADVEDDETKHFVLLINDLIRYFRTICVNYHATKQEEPPKWPIRNIKLRHSRVLMYTSLLFCLGELSKPEYAAARRRGDVGVAMPKREVLQRSIAQTPLERFVWLYDVNRDDNIFRLLSLYNNFLEGVGGKESRAALHELEYGGRYDLPAFATLKANSDAFAAELMRFLFARRGTWSDRFYEYVIL